MRTAIIIAFVILSLGLDGQVSDRGGSGPHGGLLNFTPYYKIEMTSSNGCLIAYLYDKDMTPISNKGISGEILLVYSDNASISKKLNLYEGDGLMIEEASPYYIYCVLTLNISGKMITSKFINQYGLADKQSKKPEKTKQ